MKIRNGFVSNSSSSSFIIAVPNTQENVRSTIEKVFELPKDHPMINLTKIVLDQITSQINETTQLRTWEDFKEEFGIEEGDENFLLAEKAKKAYDKNWTVFVGQFESNSIDLDLTCTGFDIDNDKLIFWSEEGY
jgi:hypothetical protein